LSQRRDLLARYNWKQVSRKPGEATLGNRVDFRSSLNAWVERDDLYDGSPSSVAVPILQRIKLFNNESLDSFIHKTTIFIKTTGKGVAENFRFVEQVEIEKHTDLP
jgi:hypothetical protein